MDVLDDGSDVAREEMVRSSLILHDTVSDKPSETGSEFGIY